MSPPTPLLTEGYMGMVRGKHGPMIYNANDLYIGRSIQLYGEFSEFEVQLFMQLIKPGDVVVEVGANIGAHSVPLAKRVGPQGRFLGFEPQHAVYQMLCGNLALNGLGHMRCYWSACGSAAGEIIVPPLDQSRPENFGGLALGQYQRGDRVPVITLDSLQLTSCDLLKVDVEGMELQVLHGARQTIQRSWPYLYVENDRPENSPALINLIMELGYTCYWHLPPMYNPQNHFRNQHNVFPNIVSVNMLCVPASRSSTQVQLRKVEGPNSHWQAPANAPAPAVSSSPSASASTGRVQTSEPDAPQQQSSPPQSNTTSVENNEQRLAGIQQAMLAEQFAVALQYSQKLTALSPEHFAVTWSTASAAITKGQFAVAVQLLERLSELSPEEPAIHSNLGAAYGRLEQHQQAADCFRKALQVNPSFADAHFNYGNALREIGQFQASVDSCRRGLALQPDSANGHFLLANVLADVGQNSEAKHHYEQALRLSPQHAGAHKNLGILLLRLGELEDGWREYEWRFPADGVPAPTSRFTQPYWDGTPLAGRRLLLCGEQGLGDQIQFMRYVFSIEGNVTLQVHPRLLPLLKPAWPNTISFDDPRPSFDVHAPLMSLPRILGIHARREPCQRNATEGSTDGYLIADEARIAKWHQRLAQYPGFKVGIAWQGSRENRRDRLRSIPLKCFEPLVKLPQVQLVSLQKLDGLDQSARLDWSDRLLDFSSEMDPEQAAFLDTAAMIKNLNLVITIDSAVAHLAGGLGAPTWLLLRRIADWRWQLEGEHTEWYPSLTLLRQPVLDDWNSLMPSVAERLQAHLNSLGSRRHPTS